MIIHFFFGCIYIFGVLEKKSTRAPWKFNLLSTNCTFNDVVIIIDLRLKRAFFHFSSKFLV